jgi:hypothetical protein
LDPDLILRCLQQSWTWRPLPDLPLELGIVAGYALAVALSALVALRAPFADARGRARGFWILLALFLLVVGLLRAFDLQLLVTDTARCVARGDGWYRDRDAVKSRYVAAALVLVASLGLSLVWWLRRALLQNLPALAGGLALAGLGAARAASIREIDNALRAPLLGLRLDRWIEIAALALVLIAALWLLWRRRRR